MDRVPKEVRSRIMSAIRSQSGIEKLPRQFKGSYLRSHPKGVFGKPDFGNKARKIAVFIDGCFWHGCPKCYREPKSNMEFWKAKIQRNKARDNEVNQALLAQGWQIHRIWECEL